MAEEDIVCLSDGGGNCSLGVGAWRIGSGRWVDPDSGFSGCGREGGDSVSASRRANVGRGQDS